MKLIKQLKTIVLALAVVALAGSADAQGYLLTIDISDPSHVIINATGNAPIVSSDVDDVTEGITLFGFFGIDVAASGTLSGHLRVPTYNPGYYDYTKYQSQVTIDTAINFTGGGLNLASGSLQYPQPFSIGSAAFIGTAIGNFSSSALYLPVVGQTGNILPGNQTDGYGPIIGQWVIIGPVPEPGTMALAGLGGMSTLIYLRRRKHLVNID